MSEEFGSGLFLDEQFDFSVDNTGDIRSTTGTDELQKDLAFQMVINLDRFIGQPPTGNIDTQVLDTATRVALADTRVSSVDQENSTVSFSVSREEITVKLIVRTDDGEQPLVFNV